MKRKSLIYLILIFTFSAFAFAQETDEFQAERKQAWKAFARKGWDKLILRKRKSPKPNSQKFRPTE